MVQKPGDAEEPGHAPPEPTSLPNDHPRSQRPGSPKPPSRGDPEGISRSPWQGRGRSAPRHNHWQPLCLFRWSRV